MWPTSYYSASYWAGSYWPPPGVVVPIWIDDAADVGQVARVGQQALLCEAWGVAMGAQAGQPVELGEADDTADLVLSGVAK